VELRLETAHDAGMKGKILLVFLLLFGFGQAARAQRVLPDARAVGLLQLGPAGGCTATLIAPDVVLTAAHCLLAKADGAALKPENFTFRPTRPDGRPGAAFLGRDVVVHPIYLLPGLSPARRVMRDLALLWLARPVPREVAQPLALLRGGAAPETGLLISFRGALGGPARRRECPVVAADVNVLELGCDVKRGESGAPVLVMRDGALVVAGVVSSRSQNSDGPVTLAARLGPGFSGLLEASRP